MIDHTKSSRDESIRARLLNSLGIHKDPSSSKTLTRVISTGEICNDTQSASSSAMIIAAVVENKMTCTATTATGVTISCPPSNATDVILLNKVPAPAHRESLNDSKEQQLAEELKKKKGHRRIPSRKRIVQFDSDVIVQPIASHKAYSKRVRHALWTSPDELNDHVYRNTAEFMAEGMDWKKVLEDDDMYMDAKTGELIHPYWVEGENSYFEAVDNGEGAKA
jgi:hypothetical protein